MGRGLTHVHESALENLKKIITILGDITSYYLTTRTTCRFVTLTHIRNPFKLSQIAMLNLIK